VSTAATPDESILATTVVAVDPETAFTVFTEEVDAWWKHGPRFRTGAPGQSLLRFEPGTGGRLVETFDDAADPFELGRITAWEPPSRLVFEMFARAFQPGETTEVEVRFEPTAGGTRVTVEHRGWSAFGPEHPVRHGLVGEAFVASMGVFWGDLLVVFRAAAARGSSVRAPGREARP
jgi:uncharacterized protein YndB with AHSA1/START domain